MTLFTHLSQSVPVAFAAPVKPGDMQRGPPCPEHKPLWQPSSFLGSWGCSWGLIGGGSCELWSLPQRPPSWAGSSPQPHPFAFILCSVCSVLYPGHTGLHLQLCVRGPLTSSLSHTCTHMHAQTSCTSLQAHTHMHTHAYTGTVASSLLLPREGRP